MKSAKSPEDVALFRALIACDADRRRVGRGHRRRGRRAARELRARIAEMPAVAVSREPAVINSDLAGNDAMCSTCQAPHWAWQEKRAGWCRGVRVLSPSYSGVPGSGNTSAATNASSVVPARCHVAEERVQRRHVLLRSELGAETLSHVRLDRPRRATCAASRVLTAHFAIDATDTGLLPRTSGAGTLWPGTSYRRQPAFESPYVRARRPRSRRPASASPRAPPLERTGPSRTSWWPRPAVPDAR